MYKISELIDVTQQQLESFTKEELRERVKDMNRWVQKRISGFTRFHKGEGISRSPALVQYQRRGAKKLAYGENVSYDKLTQEYMRGLYFLKAESSKASAWNKIQSKIIQGIYEEVKIRIKKSDFDKFWDTYQKLIEARPDLALPENKYEAFRTVAKMLYGNKAITEILSSRSKGRDITDEGDALVGALTRGLDDLYEKTIKHQTDEIGGMFKLKKHKSKKKGSILDVDTDGIDVDIELDDLF